jgi:flagellar hook assembly protein FlgD
VPNPFNSQTTIRYEIPEASDVQIAVYNLKKQKVRTLLARRMEAGAHQVVWDGRDESGKQVASGTYWVHMQAAPFQGTLKVTFAK